MSEELATISQSCRKTEGAEAVGRWWKMAFHCRDLASHGQSETAQKVFAELNQEIKQFLRSWRKQPAEFEVVVSELHRLLDEVNSWRKHVGVAHLEWTWTFHHAFLRD